ncbi:sphingolipid 8-(E)-desaturase [Malassezia yamatoensis]|uniref:Delta 8-(E)-sphingolipid desaturase n=1 Tax=Malassezia yamatoensis TaxID=253288 RepID=A0AAJ5YUI0_9BASI|nr:sphingolipid 8-(E)-desaturase [Malassezia yamatoensis]
MELPKRVLTRAEIAQRVAQGEVLVLHRRLIYKLDNWMKTHPGGDLAILHFVGRDAKDEIEAYHSQETITKLMRRFVIAQLASADATDLSLGRVYRPLMPPIQLGYRNGTLDHPDAQLAAWQASEQAKENKARITHFPLPVSLLEPPPSKLSLLNEARISQAYEAMHQKIKDAGLYELQPRHYAREISRYTVLALLSYFFFQVAKQHHGYIATALYMISAASLGFMWHQLTFLAHDAGHTSITHNYTTDRLIGVVVASLFGGLSLVWWCDNHDVHHLVTNHPEHDPDIQHMPIFAVSPRFVSKQESDAINSSREQASYQQEPDKHKASSVESHLEHPSSNQSSAEHGMKQNHATDTQFGLWSSYYRRVLYFDAFARVLIRFQHKLYFFIMSLARFNLYALSYTFLLMRARRDRWFWLETSGLVGFWTWFAGGVLSSLPSWGMVVGYLLISHICASPVHVQIVLSHFAQDTSDLGPQECFASRQIRTTMDVQCPSYLDFVHGGLHMQVTHHLFPRLPRHNLREARDKFVKPFCKEFGLVYEEHKFVRGNNKVLSQLKDVADQVSFFYCVAEAQAKGEIHH